MAVCDADGRFDRCRHFLFIVVVRPTDSLRRPIGMLPDLCTIIEYAMYTDSNPETIIQTFLVHGHPITHYFMNFAIYDPLRDHYCTGRHSTQSARS